MTDLDDYKAMTSGAMLQALGDDAHKWATAYCQHFPEGCADHATMIGWFANAIEHSYAIRNADAIAQLRVPSEADRELVHDQRRWLARQLLDDRLSDDEAYGIVAWHPRISDEHEPLAASPQPPAQRTKSMTRRRMFQVSDGRSIEEMQAQHAAWEAERDADFATNPPAGSSGFTRAAWYSLTFGEQAYYRRGTPTAGYQPDSQAWEAMAQVMADTPSPSIISGYGTWSYNILELLDRRGWKLVRD